MAGVPNNTQSDPWAQFPDSPAQENDPWADFPEYKTHQRGSEVTNLPAPTHDMFADMDDEDAKAVYAAYERHPKSQRDPKGNLFYNGIPVPKSEGNHPFIESLTTVGNVLSNPIGAASDLVSGAMSGDPVGAVEEIAEEPHGVGGAVLGQTYNVGRNMAETGASLVEAAIPGEETPMLDAVRSTPAYNPEGVTQHVTSDLTEVLHGIVLGNKALAVLKGAGVAQATIAKMSENLPKIINATSKMLSNVAASGAGTAATVESQSDTLVHGDNTIFSLPKEYFPILRGIEWGSPGSAEREISDRLNVLIDSAIISAPIEMAGGAGRKAWDFVYDRFVKPVSGALSESKKSDIVMEEILSAVDGVVNASGKEPEKAAMWRQKIIDILSDPNFSQIDEASPRPGMSPQKFKLDTASTISRGLAGDNTDEAIGIKKLFSERRKDVIERGGDHIRTKLALDKPIRETEKFLNEGIESTGGDLGIDAAREGLQTTGEGKIVEAIRNTGDPVGDAQKTLSEARKGYEKDFAETDLGSGLKKATDEPFSRIYADRNKLTEEILGAEDTGSKSLKERSSGYIDEIPDDLEVDPEVMADALDNAKDYLTEPMRKIMDDAGVQWSEPIDEDDVAELISGGNFKILQRLRPYLEKEIATKGEDLFGGQELRDLLNVVSKTKDKTAKNALKKKGQFDTETLRPITEQGLPKRFDEVRKQYADDVPTMKDELGKTLDSGLKSDQPNVADHFASVLARKEYGKSHKKIAQYAIADTVDQLRMQVKSNAGLSEIDPTDILKTIKQYRQGLSNAGLKEEVAELDSLADLVTKHKKDFKALEAALKTKVGDPRQIRDDIYGDVLSDFFTRQGVREPDGYESFKKVFLNPQATGVKEKGKLDRIIELAEQDPVVMEGMKAAWLKHFKSQVLASSPDALGGKGILPAKATAILEGEDKIFQIGERIFSSPWDKPIINTLRTLLDPALDATVTKKGAAFASEDPASMQKAKEATSRMIAAIVSPLSRVGTRGRAGASTILEFVNPNDKRWKIADAIMSDSQGFLKAFNQFQSNSKAVSPTFRHRDLFNWLAKSGIYNESDRNEFNEKMNEVNEDKQTEDVFPDK